MVRGSNEKGGALISVLLILTMLITLGTALLTLSGTEFQIGLNQSRGIKALYLAEAGLRMGIAELVHNANWRGTNPTLANIAMGEGEIVSVTIADRGSYLSLEGTGRVGGVTRVATMQVQTSPFLQGIVIKADNTGGTELVLTGGTRFEGNFVFAGNLNISSSATTINGNVTVGGWVRNSGTINGNVIAGGSITNTGSGRINGTATANADVRIAPVPTVDLAYYQGIAKTAIQGNVSWTMAQLQAQINSPVPQGKENVIYINGDVNISTSKGDRYTGRALVVATGRIILNGGMEAASLGTDALGFVSPTNIQVDTLGWGNAEALFHTNGTFQTTTGGNDIRGGIVAYTMILASNQRIVLVPELAMRLFSLLQSEQVFTVFDWREK